MSLKTHQYFARTQGVKQCYSKDNTRVTGTNLIASISYEPNDQTEFTLFSETPFLHLYNLEFGVYCQVFLCQECFMA